MKHALLALFCLVMAGCASVLVPDSTALTPAQLRPPGSDTVSEGGYRYGAIASNADNPEWLILVAMSGGGKRSAAFSYGVLQGMRDMPVPAPASQTRLLDQVDVITGISGGSFTAAYYGLHREAMFGRYEEDFLYRDTNAHIFGIYLFPWNWTWLTDPSVGTNDFMAQIYDRTMFHGHTYRSLARLGRPLIALGATDISYGRPFAFIQEYFDLICSDLEALPISRAVAASNGFPGLFSPVTLTNHRAECGDRQPAWLRHIPAGVRNDPLSRLGEQARAVEPYLDPAQTRFVHLADGGITDNLGLRVAGSMIQTMAAAPEVILARGDDRLRRILLISIDGQGTQDTSTARTRLVGGIFSLIGLVSGAQIDRYNFETLTTVTQQLREAEANLRRIRCAKARVLHGAPCDDVKAELVHVSLAGMADGPDKDRLLAIPTGLTIDRQDVDALVAAGGVALRQSEALHRSLTDLAPAPVPVPVPVPVVRRR
jgi:NTE family protein